MKKYFEKNFEKFADFEFSSVIGSERERNRLAETEGGEELELSPSQIETIRRRFDCFCKNVMRNTRKNYLRDLHYIAEYEITFSELPQDEMDSLFVLDEYSTDSFHFAVNGFDVPIKNEALYNALSELPPRKRDIVLLAYFLGMTDVEIALALNMVSRTVQYQRTSTLAKLYKLMGGNEHEQT